MIWQQFANGLAIGSVYALIALGLTMVYGVLRILHIAHAGVYVLGAYIGLLAFRLVPNFWLALGSSMVGCALAGIIIQRYLYMPLLALSRIVPLIVVWPLPSVGPSAFMDALPPQRTRLSSHPMTQKSDAGMPTMGSP